MVRFCHVHVQNTYNHTFLRTAFSGRFCEEDRNGCSEIQCFEGVVCMDVPAPGVGAVCGDCPPGYTGDSLKCYGMPAYFVSLHDKSINRY